MKQKKYLGFTMVELLVAMAIIGLLIATRYLGYRDRPAKRQEHSEKISSQFY